MITKLFLICSFATAPLAALHAQTVETDGVLKDRLAAKCREHQLPALWAGRFDVDGTITLEVAGVRKWQQPELARVDDVVHLGSCTKAMTAVIAAQLCTEGKLTLDTTLKEVFSETPQLRESPWGDVKIIELMQHRSGALENLNWEKFDTAHPQDVISARQMMLESLLQKRRPKSPKFAYSNVGFALLGHVAEKIEQRSWEQIIQTRLFDRLDLKSAGFGAVGQPDGRDANLEPLSDRAWGHTPTVTLANVALSLLGRDQGPAQYTAVQIDNSPSLGPAGRAHMNLRDWSKFVICFAQAEGAKTLGISPEIFKRMLTPPADADPSQPYAGGWIVFDKPAFGGQAFFHNGSNTSWYAYALAAPNKKCCTLVVSNVYTDGAQQACDEIARYLMSL